MLLEARDLHIAYGDIRAVTGEECETDPHEAAGRANRDRAADMRRTHVLSGEGPAIAARAAMLPEVRHEAMPAPRTPEPHM